MATMPMPVSSTRQECWLGRRRSWALACVVLAAAWVLVDRPLNFFDFGAPPQQETQQWSAFSQVAYRQMRDDVARTSAYYQAIDALAPGKVVLDLGTGALALLALRCAASGAKRVYAVEAEPKAAELARNAVAAAGLQDRIVVIQGKSQDIELPEQVELVVHELVGEIAGREGVAATLRDCASRHVLPEALKGGVWSIPEKVCTWIAPCKLPPKSYFEADSVRTDAILEAEQSASGMPMRLQEFPVMACALAEPRVVEEIVFRGPAGAAEGSLRQQSRKIDFEIGRAGALAGFSLHVTVDCGAGSPEVSSAVPGSHWANGLLLASPRVAVEKGDVIQVSADIDLEAEQPTYTLRAPLWWRGTLEAGADPAATLLDSSFQ